MKPCGGTSRFSRDIDLALRRFFRAQGSKKGNLSKSIKETVRSQVFQHTVRDIKARNADTDPDALQSLIDDAVHSVRTGVSHPVS